MDMAAVEYLSHDQLVEIIKKDIRCADYNNNLENEEFLKTKAKMFRQKNNNYSTSVCSSSTLSSDDNTLEVFSKSNKTTILESTTSDNNDGSIRKISDDKNLINSLKTKQNKLNINFRNDQQQLKNYIKNDITNITNEPENFKQKTNEPILNISNIQLNKFQNYNLNTEQFNDQKLIKTKTNECSEMPKSSVFTSYVVVKSLESINDEEQLASSSASETEVLGLKSGASTISSQSSCHENKNPIYATRSFPLHLYANKKTISNSQNKKNQENVDREMINSAINVNNYIKRDKIQKNLTFDQNYSSSQRLNNLNTSNEIARRPISIYNYNNSNNTATDSIYSLHLNYNSRSKVFNNSQKFNNSLNLLHFNKKLSENYDYYKRIADMKQKSMHKAATVNLSQKNKLIN